MKRIDSDTILQWFEMKVTRRIGFFVISMMTIFIMYMSLNPKIEIKVEQKKANNQAVLHAGTNLLGTIEEIIEHKKNLVIRGWAISVKDHVSDIDLIFSSLDDVMNYVYVNTDLTARNDLKEKFKTDWDFQNCGFVGTVDKGKIKKDECYEVFISMNLVNGEENKQKISTGKFYYNGKMYNYDPREMEYPNINSATVSAAIEQGELISYAHDYGIWIFMNENKLLWVVDEAKVPSYAVQPGIPCYLYVNDKSQMSDVQYEYSNEGLLTMGMTLDEVKYVQGDGTSYYVATRELPTESLIPYVITGLWEETKGWLHRCVYYVE